VSTRGIFIPLYTDFQILHGVTRYRAILLIHLYYRLKLLKRFYCS